MINHWRNPLWSGILSYLLLGLLLINPALALQYQHFNQATDFLSQIPAYQAPAFHIHASQRDRVVALLQQQGYEVIPASTEQARHFLNHGLPLQNQATQLAANADIEQPPQSDCFKTRRGEDCPENCIDDTQINDKGCPEECLHNPCTDTDPVERAKDRGPVTNDRTTTKPAPRRTGTIGIDTGFRLPRISGGNGKDTAAVMLIVIGIVVVAALFIYAGKWLIDQFQNDDDYYAYWWDIGWQIVNLDTGANQHGNFSGIKFSGGFVPNMHTNFGLTAEVGRMDLDLLYNRNSTPTRVNIEGTYWLLGPIVRWLIGSRDTDENFVHNSYVYLELLGGNTDQDGVDLIGVGRIGFNTGIGKQLRLGLHYGAFYLGLDEDQGIANDGDNYWNMYGIEIGYQF